VNLQSIVHTLHIKQTTCTSNAILLFNSIFSFTSFYTFQLPTLHALSSQEANMSLNQLSMPHVRVPYFLNTMTDS
jgi:hypothetical protein